MGPFYFLLHCSCGYLIFTISTPLHIEYTTLFSPRYYEQPGGYTYHTEDKCSLGTRNAVQARGVYAGNEANPWCPPAHTLVLSLTGVQYPKLHPFSLSKCRAFGGGGLPWEASTECSMHHFLTTPDSESDCVEAFSPNSRARVLPRAVPTCSASLTHHWVQHSLAPLTHHWVQHPICRSVFDVCFHSSLASVFSEGCAKAISYPHADPKASGSQSPAGEAWQSCPASHPASWCSHCECPMMARYW